MCAKDIVDAKLAKQLLAMADKINRPEFAESDPVQFPRRFSEVADIEIASLLCATLAWGRRSMICRDCERLLTLMQGEPHRFVMNGDIEAIPDSLNIHRTFFGRDLKHYLRGLRLIYSKYPVLDAMCAERISPQSEAPAWEFAALLDGAMADANGGCRNSQCVPTHLAQTPLKRINMALRWLVRRDGIVDLGVWQSITPDRLYIPLDVHVGNTARRLGLLSRKANDRKAVIELTEKLRIVCPSDPVLLDFALFGMGIENKDLTEI